MSHEQGLEQKTLDSTHQYNLRVAHARIGKQLRRNMICRFLDSVAKTRPVQLTLFGFSSTAACYSQCAHAPTVRASHVRKISLQVVRPQIIPGTSQYWYRGFIRLPRTLPWLTAVSRLFVTFTSFAPFLFPFALFWLSFVRSELMDAFLANLSSKSRDFLGRSFIEAPCNRLKWYMIADFEMMNTARPQLIIFYLLRAMCSLYFVLVCPTVQYFNLL